MPNPHHNPSRRCADILTWLSGQANIEFVADYYSHPCWFKSPDAKEPPLTRPLKQELDAFATEEDTSWKQTGDKIYLIRNNRWYRDDYLEVPAPLLQRWQAQLLALMHKVTQADSPSQESIKAQMDWEAEAVAALTPWQVAHGLAWAAVDEEAVPGTSQSSPSHPASISEASNKTRTIFPFSAVAVHLLEELNTARFYASLPDAYRESLIEGRLPFAALSLAQREQGAFLLPLLRTSTNKQPIWLGLQLRPASGGLSGPGAILTYFGLHRLIVSSR